MTAPAKKDLILSICTTLLWGLPALYVLMVEVISLCHFFSNWSKYSQPFIAIEANILFLLVALIIMSAIVMIWTGSRKLKLASNVFFFALSLLLIPISFVSASYGSFMYGFTEEHVAAYPLAGMLLSILSFIKYYREKK